MSNSDLLAALESAENGNDILQILNANVGNPPYADSSSGVSFQDYISSYAVDLKGNLTEF